jgi:hypothetical protein
LTVLLLLSAVNLHLHSLTHLKREIAAEKFSSPTFITELSPNSSDEAFGGFIHQCNICQSLQHGQAVIALYQPITIELSKSPDIESSVVSLPNFSYAQPSDRAPPRH